MPTDKFLVAPQNTGLQNNLKAFMIPDDAYQTMYNAYVWRGRVRKRFGSRYMLATTMPDAGYYQIASRLRLQVHDNTSAVGVAAITDGAGAYGSTVINIAYAPFAIGQAFSIGSEIFTITNIVGAVVTIVTTGRIVATVPLSGTLTLNATTHALQVTGAMASSPIYFYPAEPVMGILTYEKGNINDFVTIAFDKQFAYSYTATGWNRLTGGPDIWTGTDHDFFWACTWRGSGADSEIFFVTNDTGDGIVGDGIRYWDSATWTQLTAQYGPGVGDIVNTCRIIVPFKNRLVFLNTNEGTPGLDYTNRARWCQFGSPFDANSWREDIAGRGGWIDAPTKQRIITAQFVKDRLIVYFEESTWELVYTNNQIQPFVWQQLNSELGAQSVFSGVPFDAELFAIGYTGVHSCNGVNVSRIDNKIPDFVFDISNVNNGPVRVCGIRDYFAEMVYWSMPIASWQVGTTADTFPNTVLTYNYRNGTWGVNEDSITALGYFRQQAVATWETTDTLWNATTTPWDSATRDIKFRATLAGNQEGYVFELDIDTPTNANALQITDITYNPPTVGFYGSATFLVMNHNLKANDWIQIDNLFKTSDPGVSFSPVHGIYQVDSVTDANLFEITLNSDDFSIFTSDHADPLWDAYIGGGTIARVTPIDISTKQYNFYQQQGMNFGMPRIDFLVDRSSSGEVTVDLYTSTSSDQPINSTTLTTRPYTLIPFEINQDQLWHCIYPVAQGSYIQLNLYLSDDQIQNPFIANSDFQMHAVCYIAQPTATRLQ